MGLAESFVDGGEIEWGRLTTTLFGGVLLAIWHGTIEALLTTMRESAEIFDAVAQFGVSLVQVVYGTPASALNASWAELQAVTTSAGPLSFALSVSAVLVVGWIVAQGVERVVG